MGSDFTSLDLLIVLIWIGLWGMIDMLVKHYSEDNMLLRFTSYFAIFLIGFLIVWILHHSN